MAEYIDASSKIIGILAGLIAAVAMLISSIANLTIARAKAVNSSSRRHWNWARIQMLIDLLLVIGAMGILLWFFFTSTTAPATQRDVFIAAIILATLLGPVARGRS